ncbi:hypothetical protein MUU53_06930 [Rhizobium lemnae]|uniref:Uncharacterized protein n=1 Tax=Rhizobium lemnae TaxID=1214924 RepID=A0ABV8E5I2_9HYPH|nr:hypothetical protein [Rhizobium lemnae]MCJ8507647.1 hypothetical protein [Rhizobium lemnae]
MRMTDHNAEIVELKIVPRNRMKAAEHKRFKKWEHWLIHTLTAIHHMGAFGLPRASNILEETRNTLQAMHDGVECFVEQEEVLRYEAAPELPDAWPADFPVRLAFAAFTYIQEVREVAKMKKAARTE